VPTARNIRRTRLVTLLALGSLAAACTDFVPPEPDPDPAPSDPMADLRINEIQVIGSHNSYKTQPSPLLQAGIEAVYATQPAGTDVPNPEGMVYSHPPLAEQFGPHGIRQIELDVFVDREGGKFADPFGPGAALTLQAIFPALLPMELMIGPNFDPLSVMAEPGPKVFHIQDIDFRSSCLMFDDCLAQIAAWSNDNPNHLPIFILLELKDDPIEVDVSALGVAFTVPDPWTLADVLELEDLIRSAFHDTRMIQPNDVRNGHPTLLEGIQAEGWPRVAESRGKVFFGLDNEGAIRDNYVNQYPTLDGALIFTSSPPGSPEAGFSKVNDPGASNPSIPELVASGHLVRVRADTDTAESRNNDPTRRDAALASGAQFISTDYRIPNTDFSNYQVVFPGLPASTVARCNPIFLLADCTSEDIDP
jgi:hypothetical protein